MRHFRPFTLPDSLKDRAASLDVAALSISEIGDAFASGLFLPSELTAACLLRINNLEPYLNAFIWLNPLALEEAAGADVEVKEGRRRGPMHGVPIVLKDNMDIAGVRTTAGYAGFASDDRVVDPQFGAFNGLDLLPARDAALVSRLKEAGAIVLGKSNLPDFGLDGLRADSSHAGDTLNPYSRAFAPGASSAGSAAAVATGMGIVSIGTDTAGSILFPASAQSLVGLKPSLGLIPTAGIFPGLENHDVAGPIARSVSDAAILMDVLANSDPAARQTRYVGALRRGAFRGKRIGVFEPGIWAGALHPAVRANYARMVDVIESLGAETVPVVFGDTDWQSCWAARRNFMSTNMYLAGVDAYLAALGGNNPLSRAEFKTRAGFDIGLGNTAPLHGVLADPKINVATDSPEMAEVIRMAEELLRRYQEILAEKQIDALFMPRSINPLPDLSGDTPQFLGDQVVGTEVNELGLPAITVPAGFLEDGRPIAIDIVGPARGTETEIIALAFDFEQQTMLRKAPLVR
jgi:amidase